MLSDGLLSPRASMRDIFLICRQLFNDKIAKEAIVKKKD